MQLLIVKVAPASRPTTGTMPHRITAFCALDELPDQLSLLGRDTLRSDPRLPRAMLLSSLRGRKMKSVSTSLVVMASLLFCNIAHTQTCNQPDAGPISCTTCPLWASDPAVVSYIQGIGGDCEAGNPSCDESSWSGCCDAAHYDGDCTAVSDPTFEVECSTGTATEYDGYIECETLEVWEYKNSPSKKGDVPGGPYPCSPLVANSGYTVESWDTLCQAYGLGTYGHCYDAAGGTDMLVCDAVSQVEICGNFVDDDGDGLVDENGAGSACVNEDDPPDDPSDPDAPDEPDDPSDQPQDDPPTAGSCDDICGSCDANPVNLYSREMYAGPFEDLEIETGASPVVFARLFDSVRQKNDQWEREDRTGLSGFVYPAWVSPFGDGWRHSFEDTLVINHGYYNNDSYDGTTLSRAVLTWRSLRKDTILRWTDELGVCAGRVGGAWQHVDPNAMGCFISSAGTGATVFEGDIGGIFWLVDGNRFIWFARPTEPYGTRAHPRSDGWDVARPIRIDFDVAAFLSGAAHTYVLLNYTSGAQGNDPGGSDPFGFLYEILVMNQQGTSHAQLQKISIDWETVNGLTPILTGDNQVRMKRLRILRGGLSDVEVEFGYPAGVNRTSNRSLQRVDRIVGPQTHQLAAYTYTTEVVASDTVDRLLASVAGSTSTLEAFTWEALSGAGGAQEMLVKSHESRGVTLEYVPPTPGAGLHHNDRMDWKKHGATYTSYFDTSRGAPTQCESGICGAPNEPRTYQVSSENDHVVLGVADAPQKDGTIVFREYDEERRVLFEVTAQPSGGTPGMLVTYGVNATEFDEVAVVNATMLDARRYYYRPGGDLWVTARRQFGPNVDTSVANFPEYDPVNDPFGWFFGGTIGQRELSTITTAIVTETAGTEYFDLSISETDSDDDGVLNEPDDVRVVWSITASESETAPQIITSSRSTFYDGTSGPTGHLETIVQLDGLSGPQGGTKYEYYPLATSNATAKGRVQRVSSLMPNGSGGTHWVVSWEACSAADYDELGQLECRISNPGTSGALKTIKRQTGNFSPGSNNLPTGIVTEGETRDANDQLVGRTFEVRTADGRVIASRRDDATSTGINDVSAQISRTEIIYYGDPGATDQTTCNGQVYKRREFDAQDTLVSETEFTCDTFGRIDEVFVRDGSGNLDKGTIRVFPTALDQENFLRPLEVQELTENNVYVTTQENSYRTSGEQSSSRRNWWFQEWNKFGETQAGAVPAPPGKRTSVGFHSAYYDYIYPGAIQVMNHFEYDEAGRLKALWGGYNWANKVKTADYTYDAKDRIVVEDLVSAAQKREYTYNALGQKIRRVTKSRLTDTIVHDISYNYDIAGRLTSICANGSSCNDVQTFVYDSKGSFTGTYNTGPLSITLTDTAQQGRLAYTTGDRVTQFYEYDNLGRVTDFLQRHDTTDPNTGPYRGLGYHYSNAGQLDSIIYPSRREAIYSYGADTTRPTGVGFDIDQNGTLSAGEHVISEVVYSADGKILGWTWGPPGSGATRTYEMLALGWTEAIEDNFSTGTYRSEYEFDDQFYPYLKSENDTAPGGATHLLTTPASGTVTRSYSYHPKSAQLRTWYDRDGNYHLMNNRNPNYTQYSESFMTAPGGTVLHTSTFYVGAAGQTNPENEVKRFGSTAERVYTHFTAPTDGEVDALDYGEDGVNDVELDYGPLSNTVGLNILTGPDTGYINNWYDSKMRRIVKDSGLACGTGTERKMTRWVYGLSDQPLVEENQDAEGCTGTKVVTRKVSEYIYLGGIPVGVVVTYEEDGVIVKGPELRYLATDRQGVIRKAFATDGKLVQRLVMDPYGEADYVHESGDPDLLPPMNYRYAGQYYDEEAGLIENRWRYMSPKLHNYLSPDPMHRGSQPAFPGPQMYSYASWNPLVFQDPEGLEIVTSSPHARAAVEYIKTAGAGIGQKVRDMDRDDGARIELISDFVSPLIVLGGGGWTTGGFIAPKADQCGGALGGHYVHTTTWFNQSYAEAVGKQIGLPQTTLVQLLAHELGHVYYRYWRAGKLKLGLLVPYDKAYDLQQSLDWENHFRAPPYRTAH